ncbi:hypothetical protein I5192_22080 (plasmid) [Ruegeria sp. SCSIO 43209]|nr:hypothetical protein I5192_22080 [Ruegeria sp. SCSIO 43209]
MRATTDLHIEQAGSYTFYLLSDDGSSLRLNGQDLIDNDGLHATELQTATIELSAGTHSLEALYFEAYGDATLMLEWAGPDTGGNRVLLTGDHVASPGDGTPPPVDETPVDETPVDETPVNEDPVEDDPVDPTPVDPTPGDQDDNSEGFRMAFFALDFRPSRLSQIDFSAAADETTLTNALNYDGSTQIWEGGREDVFAVRATTDLHIEQAGSYTFYLLSDDGSSLRLNGQDLIDNDGLHATELQTATIELSAGTHSLEALYFEAYGDATLMLEWAGPDTGGNRVLLTGDHVASPGDGTPPPVDETPVDETPVDETPVNEDPVEDDHVDPTPVDPTPGDQDDNSDGGGIPPVDVDSAFSVAGGRVTTLQVENSESVESISILEGPDHGNLTVNPDNTLALVMSHEQEFSGQINFTYEVTYAGGATEVHGSTVNVQPTTQGDGWGKGDFYMLEQDENGNVVVEHGDNHREVYVSGSNDALSISDIAAIEGLRADQITAQWLVNNPEYGGSEGMALDSQAGMMLWRQITGSGSEPSSHWLLFERGYEYDGLGSIIEWGTQGESPLHPIHITAYGDGDRPTLHDNISIIAEQSDYIVFSDLEVTGGVQSLTGSHLLFDNVDFNSNTLLVDGAVGFTLNNSTVTDVYLTSPLEGGSWTGYEGATGILMSNTDGLLIQNTLFDQNGFAPDYDPNLSTSGGQPPSVFSHGVYIDYNNLDVTFRDNIVMNAANNAMMIRSGGFIEDNVLANSNAAGNFAGGNWNGSGYIGNYTLFADNVVTSAGYHVAEHTGAPSIGIHNNGLDTTMIDNIIAHLANPDNPEEIAYKEWAGYAVGHTQNPFYDDTIVYNWDGSREEQPDQNIDGLNTDILNATTIQNFTQQLLGDPNADIPDLVAFLRAQADGELDHYVDADLIIDFFQTGFGLAVEERVIAETVRFVPSDLGDGIRWDNRLNWTTEDLPGSVAGDSVDLGGNWVSYGGTTVIANLELGDGGTLTVGNGKLTVTGDTTVGEDGGTIQVSNVGQLWMNGYGDDDTLVLNVDGGRFVNTGDMSGSAQTTVTDGQAILATDGANYDVEAGAILHVEGNDAKVGFDGETGDTAVLRLAEDGTLAFSAEDGDIGGIGEFRSGAFGDDPDVASGANLGLGTLDLDLSGLSAGTYELLSVDEIIGEFSDVYFNGLAGNHDADLVVDYTNDTITLSVTEGSGSVNMSYVGEEGDMDDHGAALWAALTDGHDPHSDTLPTEIYNEAELVYMIG